MTDITVIILVGREERHIGRCLEKLAPLEPRQIVVVESQKGDRTHEIAVETGNCLGWRVQCLNEGMPECLNARMPECLNQPSIPRSHDSNIQTFPDSNISPSPDSNIQTFSDSSIQTVLTLVWHDWPGLQSTQFNWALDQLERTDLSDRSVHPAWILRLDADEYLTPDAIAWLKSFLNSDHSNIQTLPDSPIPPSQNSNIQTFSDSNISFAALEFTLERMFCGGAIRHGTNGIKMVRMFRRGRGRYADSAMDERIVYEGKLVSTPVVFYDDSLMPMSEWRAKHRGYAKREAAQALESLRTGHWTDPRKAAYYRLPPYLRAFLYFCIRYFLKLGFLDGSAGWMWNFWQGLWYRLLVDREISRLRK